MRRSILGILLSAVAGVGVFDVPVALAQEKKSSEQPAAARPGKPPVPSPEVLLMMIRTVMIASGNAITTGNFTVLRDLGTPTFAANNTAARLTLAFQDLINRRINLGPTAVATPILAVPPIVDDQGVLRIDGKFPTRPLEVNFEMSFRVFNGAWRLSGLRVGTAEPQPLLSASEGEKKEGGDAKKN